MTVVSLQAERDARAHTAFEEYAAALALARATGSISAMARAVRAFDSFMRLAGLTETERREILG